MNYRKVYVRIVTLAKAQQYSGLRPRSKRDLKRNFPNKYFEFHHILPKSMFPNWKEKESNIVPLTAREHFFCHQLLYKIYPGHSMTCALYHLSNRLKIEAKVTSREYERIRIEFVKRHSAWLKENSSNLGTHWYTNGVENRKAKECPAGYKPGRCGMEKNFLKGKTYKELYGEEFAKRRSEKISKSQKGHSRLTEAGRMKISKHLRGRRSPTKGLYWCNNGVEQKMLTEIPLGWTRGRLSW